jgi:hypothetical protein
MIPTPLVSDGLRLLMVLWRRPFAPFFSITSYRSFWASARGSACFRASEFWWGVGGRVWVWCWSPPSVCAGCGTGSSNIITPNCCTHGPIITHPSSRKSIYFSWYCHGRPFLIVCFVGSLFGPQVAFRRCSLYCVLMDKGEKLDFYAKLRK